MNTMAELKRILHVEDDRSIQAVAKLALETLGGFEVLSCINGQEALDSVVAFSPAGRHDARHGRPGGTGQVARTD